MDLNRLLQLAGRSAPESEQETKAYKPIVLSESAADIVKDKTPVVSPSFPLFRSLSKAGK
jgi:hypothetical protein